MKNKDFEPFVNVQEGGTKVEYSVKQIAEKRGVSERAIYKQIKTHEKELKGHFTKRGGKTWYDDFAVKVLEDASNQSPTIYVENEKEEELNQLREKVKELQNELDEDRKAMRKSQEAMLKLVEQTHEIAQLNAQNELFLEQKTKAEQELKELKEENEKLKAENGRFHKTIFGLWKRQ